MKSVNHDFAVCATLLPISQTVLRESKVVESTAWEDLEDYEDCFFLGLSNPREFWKERLSPEEYEIYLKRREFALIKDDFEDLDEEAYLTNDEYRKTTLNILFDAKVDTLLNL